MEGILSNSVSIYFIEQGQLKIPYIIKQGNPWKNKNKKQTNIHNLT